ncbi:hypothetical protein [Rhodobacter sp. TJ_12]|uniref:hypothetical protein n=1 Tax=Rhodobacter sp. TJ_12 TaxID=2029399 RepID=UPI001CC0020B|nr:hypothetical protein [Rhodobacter sp. TJ_12]
MPKKREEFEVYDVVSVKDAYAIANGIASNTEFNNRDAVAFFEEKGVTVYGLVAPVHRLADEVNSTSVPSAAKEMAQKARSHGRS